MNEDKDISPVEAEQLNDAPKGNLGKRLLGYAVRYLLPLALTVLLLVYLFKKVDFAEMWHIVSHGVDYWWILLAMGISVFSHVFRAARWRLQLRALGGNPPFMALCCSIFGCYALNLIFPRLGEVWRCTYIASVDRKPFTTVFGSMVADRLADTLSVLVLLGLCFVLASPALNAFLEKYPVGQGVLNLAGNPLFWIALVGGMVAIVALLYALRRSGPVKKLLGWLSELLHGFTAVATMKGRGKFLLLTLCIWGCYYLQLYVAFYAFPFTRELCAEASLGYGLIPCLVAFVLSSIGMAIPSNGGLGPWNIAVMFGLALYGISDTAGTAFSMLVWSGQTVMLILLGIYTMIYISLHNENRRS